MKTEVAKFNVGGRRYEVARSLLDLYPDTMLARSASEAWQEDPEEEIYIERDADRFAHCLDYLRDRKCRLPITVSRDAVMNDLKYYGLEDIDESAIVYAPSTDKQNLQVLNCAVSFFDELQELENSHKSQGDDHFKMAADYHFIRFGLLEMIRSRTSALRYHTDPGLTATRWQLVFNGGMTKEREARYAKYGLTICKEEINGYYGGSRQYLIITRCEDQLK